MSESMARPVLSVVVIGRNEGERLVRCLESVKAMRFPNGEVEIIYVDSASTDGSPARAKTLDVQVLTVYPERPSAALGRNAGWQAARSPLILFLDGDTLLHPDFVVKSLPAFEDDQVAVVWGHRREIRPEASIYNRVLDLDWIYPPGSSEFCGGDALMRRSVLEEVGGFDATLIAGEEPELCHRMRTKGYIILHVDRPMTKHDIAISHWQQYWRHAFRAGHAYAEIAERFRESEIALWEQEVKHNLRHGSVLLLTAGIGLLSSLILSSVVPLALVLAFFAALVLRTAFKVAWKSSDPITRLLYGIHSHFQQIPILFGQISYRWDRYIGRHRRLIEYK